MAKEMIFLSVILPTYNRKYCVGKMIDSILMQDFENYELIVIDDGSTDKTAEMLKTKYGNTDVRIVCKENGGVSSARNLGISLARGEYITFVDSDDYLLDGFFRDIFENILQHGADIYVYAGLSKQKDKLSGVPLFWGDRGYGSGGVVLKNGSEFVRDFCLYGGNSWACAKIFKISLIRENNLVFQENISYGEDMLFNLQAYLCSSKIVAIPREFYVCEASRDGLSRKGLSSKKKIVDILGVYQALEQNIDHRKYLALNCIRHMRRWCLFGLFSLDLKLKREIQKIYLQVDDAMCHPIEKIEVCMAKKNLLSALFVYKICFILCRVQVVLISYFSYLKLPFRILKRIF